MSRSLPRSGRVATVLALALALGSILGGGRSSQAIEPKRIDWRVELSRARADASALDRLLWLQFTGSWCHNCQRMDAEVFADPRVLRRASLDFLPVKLQADDHEELALSYGLSSLPATVIVGPDGAVVARVQGFLDAESYLSFLNDALKRAGRSPADPSSPGTSREEGRPVLGGYCPVSLVDGHRLIAGVTTLRADHDGQVFLLATEAARTAFLRNPERYAPVNRGDCPVARVDRGETRRGSPNFGVLYEGHLYLCGNAADRVEFLKHPDRYSRVDIADRGFCPHCWTTEGLLVRGLPSFSLTRDGRRYLFPDATHLEAFRSPTATVRR